MEESSRLQGDLERSRLLAIERAKEVAELKGEARDAAAASEASRVAGEEREEALQEQISALEGDIQTLQSQAESDKARHKAAEEVLEKRCKELQGSLGSQAAEAEGLIVKLGQEWEEDARKQHAEMDKLREVAIQAEHALSVERETNLRDAQESNALIEQLRVKTEEHAGAITAARAEAKAARSETQAAIKEKEDLETALAQRKGDSEEVSQLQSALKSAEEELKAATQAASLEEKRLNKQIEAGARELDIAKRQLNLAMRLDHSREEKDEPKSTATSDAGASKESSPELRPHDPLDEAFEQHYKQRHEKDNAALQASQAEVAKLQEELELVLSEVCRLQGVCEAGRLKNEELAALAEELAAARVDQAVEPDQADQSRELKAAAKLAQEERQRVKALTAKNTEAIREIATLQRELEQDHTHGMGMFLQTVGSDCLQSHALSAHLRDARSRVCV